MTSKNSTLPLPELDRESTSPLWFQLMRALEYAISTEHWVSGERLPSENELCKHYSISRTSVREALAHLEQSGLISRQQGRGAFVERPSEPWSWTLPAATSLLGQYGAGNQSALTSRIVRARVESLAPWVATAFSDDPQGRGVVIERVRSVGRLTAVHVVNHLPIRFKGIIPSIRDPRASLYAALEQVAGVRIVRMHRTVEAVSADRRLAQLLEIEEGHPIVVVEAVAYDGDGTPVDFSRASVRTDRLRVTVESRHDGAVSPLPPNGLYPNRAKTSTEAP